MTRTSTAPYTFTATEVATGLYFSKLIFDNDGYMTDFSAKDPSIGLDLDLGSLIDEDTTVDGLAYYRNTMGRATPPPTSVKNDFNSDGKPDILWRNTATGENAYWYMNGTTLLTGAVLLTVADLNWTIVGTGDFNSDGKTDILWRNTATGENAYWYMNGTTIAGSASILTLPDQNWTIVGTGDFNSDGKTDILWRNTATGENAIWYMNGTTLLTGAALLTVADLNWTIVGTGDFNSDGKTDILWRNTATGQNAIWYMNGTTYSPARSFLHSRITTGQSSVRATLTPTGKPIFSGGTPLPGKTRTGI